MFTGIIEETGKIRRIRMDTGSCILTVDAEIVLSGTKCGDSIAVNGVCLTVTDLGDHAFSADVMPETMRRTNLGMLRMGSPVNLERAMPANGRFGGHIVSGHIDGTGKIRSLRPEGNAVWVTVEAASGILRYVVEKGSIAIDGISLTVARVSRRDLAVSVIPHTGVQTTLLEKRCGDIVNLECDILGKYAEKLLGKESGCLTEGFLAENGFV